MKISNAVREALYLSSNFGKPLTRIYYFGLTCIPGNVTHRSPFPKTVWVRRNVISIQGCMFHGRKNYCICLYCENVFEGNEIVEQIFVMIRGDWKYFYL